MKFYIRTVMTVLLLLTAVLAMYGQAPPAPQNLTVHDGSMGGAVLEWNSSARASSYRVFKSVDGSEFFQIAVMPMTRFFDWAIYPFHHYAFYVVAANESGISPGSDTVRYSLPSPQPSGAFGVIQGSILDSSTGFPLREAVVRFCKSGDLWVEMTHTDSSGNYHVRLDTGRYHVRAEKFGYWPKWYDNAYLFQNASVVELHQDSTGAHDTATANFSLRQIPVPPVVTASGTVSDTNGQPLRGTFVAYLRPHRVLRQLSRMSFFFAGFPFERFAVPGLGVLNGVVWGGFTDSSGHYAARVLAGESHVAVAFKPGFVPQFFNKKLTPFDADRIRLSGDSSGFDFVLTPNPTATGIISGTVVDSAGVALPAHVILVRLTVGGPIIVRYQATDSLGNYAFTKLVAGRFLVRAIPIDGYAPAWYSSSLCGVRNWHNASVVNLVTSDSGIDVCVEPLRDMGFGRITGQIAGLSLTSRPASSAGGVAVEAVSATTGDVVGYDITEDDGSYAIENLPEGNYQITIDKEGYSPLSTPSVTLNQANGFESSGGSITITADPVTEVEAGAGAIPRRYTLGQNYPNPFNPTTTARFGLPQPGNVTVRVFNLIGEEVATLLEGTVQAGEHVVRWNGLDGAGKPAATGVYFLKFIATPVSGGGEIFSQVRKMILMK